MAGVARQRLNTRLTALRPAFLPSHGYLSMRARLVKRRRRTPAAGAVESAGECLARRVSRRIPGVPRALRRVGRGKK